MSTQGVHPITGLPKPPQTRAECTTADIENWNAQVETPPDQFFWETVRVEMGPRRYPRCLGCGTEVIDHPRYGTKVIDSAKKTITFAQCGCRLSVPDMPDGWKLQSEN